MKKTLLLIAAIAATLCTNAQGTWKATGTEASVAAATEITLGIPSLKCMHSDVAGVVGKSDTSAPVSTYSGVTYDNLAYIQGSTNNMYFAFLPAKSGVLDVAVKMGSGKKTFVYETNSGAYTDLTTLTASPTYKEIETSTYTVPSVYDTYNNSMGKWDATTAIQSTGANVYLVISITVTANKMYVVGCDGSKLMLRGASLAITTSANNIPASKATVVSTVYYNLAGAKQSKPCKGINIAKKTMSDGSVVTSKIVTSNSIN